MTPNATWQLPQNVDLDKMAANGPLNHDQLNSFFENGYLFIEKFYDNSYLEECENDVSLMISNLAHRLFKAGKIKMLYDDLGWTQRLLRMREDFEDAPIVLIKGGVLPVSMQKMFSEQRILDIAAQLGIGPEISLNPAWNLRGKMPAHEETVVPWHQDNSYWEPRVWDEKVLTVWAALVDAFPENGCMQMVKGGHKKGVTADHTIGSTTSTWYTEVSEETVAKQLFDKENLSEEDKITIPAKAGSILIFPGLTPHRSLNSSSDKIRWSVDFRLHAKTAKRPGKSENDWFCGLKDALVVRDPSVDNFVPDWASWAQIDRTAVQDAAIGGEIGELKEAFDPVVTGPWMDLWDIEADSRVGKEGKVNKHVERYLETDESSRDVQNYISQNNW